MKVRVDPDDVKKRKADSRGRIAIGTEYAGKTVEAAVLDEYEDDDEPEGDDQR